MNLLIPFISGFTAAAIGVLPPGLINMTAAKVSLTDGRKRGMMFVLGALIVIFIQTFISVIFANYINSHPEIVDLLRKIGLAIFCLLSIYFLFFAKKPRIKSDDDNEHLTSKRSRFFLGMFISAINFFPIPYYVLVSVSLASFGLFTFETGPIFSLVMGVATGSFAIFYLYVVFFNRMKSKTDYFIRNMNRIIGVVTGLVALITLWNVAKIHF